jgi:hypothetical protein
MVYVLSAGADPNTIYNGYGPTSVSITAAPAGGTGPYSYIWTTGSTTQSTIVTAAGTYTVTIRDSKGCATTASIAIKVIDVRCGNKNDKVIVCHNGKESCIVAEDVADHLKHGDNLGSC